MRMRTKKQLYIIIFVLSQILILCRCCILKLESFLQWAGEKCSEYLENLIILYVGHLQNIRLELDRRLLVYASLEKGHGCSF